MNIKGPKKLTDWIGIPTMHYFWLIIYPTNKLFLCHSQEAQNANLILQSLKSARKIVKTFMNFFLSLPDYFTFIEYP